MVRTKYHSVLPISRYSSRYLYLKRRFPLPMISGSLCSGLDFTGQGKVMADATNSGPVRFASLAETTVEDWQRIEEIERPFLSATADRVLGHLLALQDSPASMEVGRYEHSLQTATRAFRDNQDEETVVAALLHDIGDLLAPHDHGAFVAAVMKPFISPATEWLLRHHPVFQGYFFFDKIGKDRHERDRYRGHPAFERTVLFCERYDQVAFDINYESMPLAPFEPMVRRLFAREPWALWRDREPGRQAGALSAAQ